MLTLTGKSLVPVNLQQLQSFLNSLVPADKLPEFVIKLDGREKVKSVFAKLAGSELTVYTGAIVNLGSQKFSEVPDIVSQLMLFCLYGIKKAGDHIDFEIKSTDVGVDEVKQDAAFQMLSGKINLFVDRFNAMPVPEQPVVQVTQVAVEPKQAMIKPVKESKPKTVGGVPESPYKDVPLGEVPLVEIPADLDLRTV